MKSKSATRTFKAELIDEAEDELADAYQWYEKRRAGLGDRFYREVNHHLELIEDNPLYFPIRYDGDLRAISLKNSHF